MKSASAGGRPLSGLQQRFNQALELFVGNRPYLIVNNFSVLVDYNRHGQLGGSAQRFDYVARFIQRKHQIKSLCVNERLHIVCHHVRVHGNYVNGIAIFLMDLYEIR